MVDVGYLVELDELAAEMGERYGRRRYMFERLAGSEGRHFVGIVGPRGVGKTVLLRQLRLTLDRAFYLSADTLREHGLFDVAKVLASKLGVRTLLVDEVHFQSGFEEELKKIFDFLDLRVFFTSSVSLALYKSAHDLSRRVRLEILYPFSFGEYIWFVKDVRLPALSLDDIYHERHQPDHIRYGYLLDDYLAGGLYPLSLEESDINPLLENVVRKVVELDIPSVGSLRMDEVKAVERVLRFVGKAEVDGVNYTSVSKNVGITKYKAQAYIDLLERSFLLNPILPIGANVLKEPKVLMSVPFRALYRDDSGAVGGLREDFVAQMLRMRGVEFSYLKTKRGAKTPDFMITTAEGDLIVEVGGKGKGRQQFKGIEVHRKMILSPDLNPNRFHRPLHLVGCMD